VYVCGRSLAPAPATGIIAFIYQFFMSKVLSNNSYPVFDMYFSSGESKKIFSQVKLSFIEIYFEE
jgi:hypothetical protein